MTTTRAASAAPAPQRPPTAPLGTQPYLIVDTLIQHVNVPGVRGGPDQTLYHVRGDVAWLSELNAAGLLSRDALVRMGVELPTATPPRAAHQDTLDGIYHELGVVELGAQ